MKSTHLLMIWIVTVSFIKNLTGQIVVCHSELFVDLGTSCQKTLTAEDIGINLDPAYDYTLSRSVFDCYDVDRNFTVILEQRNRMTHEIVNSCWSDIRITSRYIPNPCERPLAYCNSDVHVTLNDEGYVNLTPEMISHIPLSSNPNLVYSVSPATLDCGHIGDNEVRLIVYSACYPTEYCTMNVNVRDEGPYRPTCYYIDTDGMEFFPANLGQQILPPGSLISFRSLLRAQGESGFTPPARFKLLLSKDHLPDNKDIILNQQTVTFNKVKYTSGKFNIPYNLPAGSYFLIADLYSLSKKFSFSFPSIIQKIQVGKSQKADEIQGRSRMTTIVLSDNLFYPNPFQNQIHLNPNADPELIIQIKIYNAMGICIKAMTLDQNALDLSDLMDGTYLMQITKKDGNNEVIKLIKQP